MLAATVSRLTTAACVTVFVSHTAYRLRIVFCLIANHRLLVISGSVHTIAKEKNNHIWFYLLCLHATEVYTIWVGFLQQQVIHLAVVLHLLKWRIWFHLYCHHAGMLVPTWPISSVSIKEFRCYEAKNRGKWKAGSRQESNSGHLWLEPPLLCHWATATRQPPTLIILYMYWHVAWQSSIWLTGVQLRHSVPPVQYI